MARYFSRRFQLFCIVFCAIPVLFMFCVLLQSCETGYSKSEVAPARVQLTGATVSPKQRNSDLLTSSFDGVEYYYNRSRRTLKITHLNAAFNSCPLRIKASVEVTPNSILISESEARSACQSLSLFDVEYLIRDIEPATFQIKIIEPYAHFSTEKITFNINLRTEKRGLYTVRRTFYPWGT